jgi:hypothetical protein
MKLCSEKSTNNGKKKGDKPWSASKRPCENYKPLQGKDKNSKGFSKTTNRKNKKMKITSEEWNMKSLKRKENSLELLRNSPERAISTKKNSSS